MYVEQRVTQDKPIEATRRRAQGTARLAEPSAEQLLAMYRGIRLSRRLDDLEIGLKRQNQIYFQISGAGHEIALWAASQHLRPGHDWFFPYYRDRALALGLGITAEAMLLQAVGAAECKASGGRQMPNHWGDRDKHVVSEASTTGTQYLSAVGCAEGGAHLASGPEAKAYPLACDEVIYCSSGEGATSQGTFFEALGSASLGRLPIIFHIEDNGWAISTPREQQTPGGSISQLVSAYPHLKIIEFDGCDARAAWRAWAEGVAYARSRNGPVLMHAHVVRPYSHSLSDDEKLYRSKADLEEQTRRDPVPNLRAQLARELADGETQLMAIEAEVEAELDHARERAAQAAPPKPSSALDFVFSPTVDPCADTFLPNATLGDGNLTIVDAVNRCLVQEMTANDRIVVFGEDVADAREEHLELVRGKGGVFKVTHGLQRRFGVRRVFNTPLAEANIVGRAFGMALRGLKPVVEIQFFDYIWPAMMQIRSEIALLRWRSNNTWSCPLVMRAAYGGYLRGGSIFHSQTGESIFTHIPGLRVCLPSTAADAAGLLRTAMRCEDPVLFLEHKHLYRQPFNRCEPFDADYCVPFGRAATVTDGDDITLVTYGALVKRSLDAVREVEREGISVHLIDLRTLSPYDWEAIASSVRRTSRVLVFHVENKSWGFGAEIAARIGEELFDCLDAPVRRVASCDTFVGYHPDLEDFILPQPKDVAEALRGLAAY